MGCLILMSFSCKRKEEKERSTISISIPILNLTDSEEGHSSNGIERLVKRFTKPNRFKNN